MHLTINCLKRTVQISKFHTHAKQYKTKTSTLPLHDFVWSKQFNNIVCKTSMLFTIANHYGAKKNVWFEIGLHLYIVSHEFTFIELARVSKMNKLYYIKLLFTHKRLFLLIRLWFRCNMKLTMWFWMPLIWRLKMHQYSWTVKRNVSKQQTYHFVRNRKR